MKRSNALLGIFTGLFGNKGMSSVQPTDSKYGKLSMKEWRRRFNIWKAKERPLPKGTKRFYFNAQGVIDEIQNSVWNCIALNEKNAYRKFKKYYGDA